MVFLPRSESDFQLAKKGKCVIRKNISQYLNSPLLSSTKWFLRSRSQLIIIDMCWTLNFFNKPVFLLCWTPVSPKMPKKCLHCILDRLKMSEMAYKFVSSSFLKPNFFRFLCRFLQSMCQSIAFYLKNALLAGNHELCFFHRAPVAPKHANKFDSLRC